MTFRNVSIIYDKSLKIMTLSPSSWTATAPTQWFDNYRIISIIDNPLAGHLGVIDLRPFIKAGGVEYKNVKEIFSSATALDCMVKQYGLGDYRYLLNRSNNMVGRPVLGNSHAIVKRFENKVWFRENFSNNLHFPDFKIVKLDDMRLPGIFTRLSAMLTTNMVLQHDALAGSRGTHFASNAKEFENAVNELSSAEIASDCIVVSKRLLKPRERTVQACVTSEDVLVGPAQAQLVRHPLLVPTKPGAIQFCGGRIAGGLVTDAQYADMAESTKLIGVSLQKEGYRGVFGVDFLIEDKKVYVIETNPRMTGLTTLLAFLQTEVPFLLLHILELSGEKYTINMADLGSIGEGSFLQIYAQNDGFVSIRSGLYDQNLSFLGDGFENGSIIPNHYGQYFVALRVSPGEKVVHGKSLAFIYSKEQLFDDNDNLSAGVTRLIENFRKDFTIVN